MTKAALLPFSQRLFKWAETFEALHDDKLYQGLCFLQFESELTEVNI